MIHFAKCLRCGSTIHVHVDGTAPSAPSAPSTRADPAPEDTAPALSTLYALGLSSAAVSMFDALRQTYGVWRGLSIFELAEGLLKLDVTSLNKGYMPYLVQGFEWYQIRRIGTAVPKVLTTGPAGPALLPNRATTGQQVIVEGWADGVAIPYPYSPLVLMGTSNARKCSIQADCIVATDGDAAGRSAAAQLLRLGIKAGKRVYYAALPEGKDPADLGRVVMAEILTKSILVSNLSQLSVVCA